MTGSCVLQTLRRRIDLLSKQKSDTKASLAAVKSSCEGKADDNNNLKAQIKVSSCTDPQCLISQPPRWPSASLMWSIPVMMPWQKPNQEPQALCPQGVCWFEKVTPDLL